jgi:undecaprenyl-diphosphatase
MPAAPHLRRRARPRGVLWDLLFASLRAAIARVRDLRAAVGVVLLAGILAAAAGTALFAWFAAHVRSGRTQGWDEAFLRYLAEHRIPWLESTLVEVTLLGTATVVVAIAGVAALFLALTRHKASAALLLSSTAGSVILNNVLKTFFDRPRPQIFTWGTHALTTSFPSGHAMSAATVYATIAYLVARLEKRRSTRRVTYVVATLFIVAISFSRLYLGVHYPSDVLAGLVVGLAWAGFCMAMLEAVQWYQRRSPRAARRPGARAGQPPADAAAPAEPP